MRFLSINLALCLAVIGAPAAARTITYTLDIGDLSLIEVEGGYEPDTGESFPETDPVGTITLVLDTAYFDYDFRGLRITQTADYYFDAYPETRFYRNGVLFAEHYGETQWGEDLEWFHFDFPVDSLGLYLELEFADTGHITDWSYGTSGENSSYGFNPSGGTSSYAPDAIGWGANGPARYRVDGPLVWTASGLETPASVPLPASGLLLGAAALGMTALRGRRRAA